MLIWIVTALFVFIVAAVVLGVILALRRRVSGPEPIRPALPEPPESVERRRAAQELGDELLARRIALDSRRGTLAGNSELDDALVRLEEKARNGEISESEFEAEKVRLLGG